MSERTVRALLDGVSYARQEFVRCWLNRHRISPEYQQGSQKHLHATGSYPAGQYCDRGNVHGHRARSGYGPYTDACGLRPAFCGA